MEFQDGCRTPVLEAFQHTSICEGRFLTLCFTELSLTLLVLVLLYSIYYQRFLLCALVLIYPHCHHTRSNALISLLIFPLVSLTPVYLQLFFRSSQVGPTLNDFSELSDFIKSLDCVKTKGDGFLLPTTAFLQGTV